MKDRKTDDTKLHTCWLASHGHLIERMSSMKFGLVASAPGVVKTVVSLQIRFFNVSGFVYVCFAERTIKSQYGFLNCLF